MAYTVAQLRKSSDSGVYMTNINATACHVSSLSPFGTGKEYQDYAFEGNFEEGKTYFLNISILRVPQGFYSQSQPNMDSSMYSEADTLKFRLILRNNTDSDPTGDYDFNNTFQVNRVERDGNTENTRFTYTTVFTPKSNYKYLVLKLTRISYDELVEDRQWLDIIDTVSQDIYDKSTLIDTINVTGPTIEVGDIASLNDICPHKPLLKIGFQSRPGTLIVVNKYPIRVGRSGIYQLNNGTKIYSFMIAAPGGSTDKNKIDAFLLDYAYQS